MAQQKTTTLSQWIGWITNVYWFFVVIYVVVLFIIGQGFRNMWAWFTVIGLVLYPYLVSYLIEYVPRWI